MLTAVQRDTIAEYVRSYLEVPFALGLPEANVRTRAEDCVYRLQPKAQQATIHAEMVLFLSPDQRFLGREILDLTGDPIRARRARTSEIWRDVSQGIMPIRGNRNAPILIVMFEDFNCHKCAEVAKWLQEIAATSEAKVAYAFIP
jgi:Thioredoxin